MNKKEMRSLILFGTLLTLLVAQVTCRAVDDNDDEDLMDNEIGENGISDAASNTFPDRLSFWSKPPAKILQAPGTSIELVCEIASKPPPKVQWIRGTAAQVLESYEMNNVVESVAETQNQLVQVRSVLVVDHASVKDRTFTCIAESGGKVIYATSTVYSMVGHGKSAEQTMSGYHSKALKKPVITYGYINVFDTLGSNVLLPCRAAGRPHPEIFWTDEDNEIITNRDPRFKVLPTGELLISHLKYDDTGVYKCVAQSPVGKDSIETFIYVVQPSP